MLPKQLIYAIENYKFEVTIVFYFAVAAMFLPLLWSLNSISIRTVKSSETVTSAVAFSHTNVDPNRPIAIAQTTATAISPIAAATPGWPLRGKVTTEFGVPHQPWQPTHTGLDISSGQTSGRAAISTFKDGVVLKVVLSSSGLGNHVIIDHGGGMTSVYAHMYSISVQEDQTVRAGEAIGTEGRSGAVTGTHLHFEIRTNNMPVNPRNYLAS